MASRRSARPDSEPTTRRNFTQASRLLRRASSADPLHLLHSGILYPHDRDPSVFFAALATLARRGIVSPDNLRVTLRASGHDEVLRALISAPASPRSCIWSPRSLTPTRWWR
jgi:hypothetical protein